MARNRKAKDNTRAADHAPPPIGHNKPPRELRLAIVGSRDFSNPRLLAEIMDEYKVDLKLVISGGADGADKLGAKWARKNRIETLIFKPDHKKYKHAYHHRNRLIVEAADLVIAFWNGHSTGTAYTVAYAKKLEKPVRVVRF